MKILIVDDSETLRTQLRRDLEAANFKVVEATDGVHAVDVAEAESDVRLIICDLNMPRLDGLGFCQKIKASAKYKDVPFLMMTTESSPELKTQGKSVGVLAWITKPYAADKLVAVIRKLLG